MTSRLAAPLAALGPLPRLLPHTARLHTTPRLAGPTKATAVPGSEAQEDDPKQGGEGFFGTLIYGSKEAKAEGLVGGDSEHHPHSALVGRNKYIHEKITHSVPPSSRDAYLAAAQRYYEALIARGASLGGIKVMGSWENIVGDVGSFTHILEHEGYKGYDQSLRGLRRDTELSALQSDMLTHITSRQHQLVSEFSFWPSSPPTTRVIPMGPGSLLDWEYAWRQGLEARKKFVSPVGAFFSQAGLLHEVHHIWQYPDMETRKRTRDQAWTVGSWSNTVKDTVKLAYQMRSQIMVPTPFSPIK